MAVWRWSNPPHGAGQLSWPWVARREAGPGLPPEHVMFLSSTLESLQSHGGSGHSWACPCPRPTRCWALPSSLRLGLAFCSDVVSSLPGQLMAQQ